MTAQRERYHIQVKRRVENVAMLGEERNDVEFFDVLIDGERITSQAFCRHEVIELKRQIIEALEV